jgi:MSHA biogenesis protein MshM
MYRRRFGLTSHPLPRDAHGKSFFVDSPGYHRLERAFADLLEDRGVGLLTAEAGVGKTAAIRNLCRRLPAPDHHVLYLCDTAVSPLDLYRTLAQELGIRPSHRRGQLWTDIKKTLTHMVDERATTPLVVIDEAQHLSDRFLIDLSGFLNFAFDSRDLLCLWLVGLPPLAHRLQMQQHAPLAMRVHTRVGLEPLERESFCACVQHGLAAAGATSRLLADPALEMLYRASRGLPRVAARLLRTALRAAHERDQSFVDEHTMQLAVDELAFLPAVRP